jgi:hypothetical protein
MSDQIYDDIDDAPEVQPGELVHWMEPRPLSFGATEISIAVGAAFVLGLATATLLTAILRNAGPERRMSTPLERKLRRLS